MRTEGITKPKSAASLPAQGLDLVGEAVLALRPVHEGQQRVSHLQLEVVELEEIGDGLLLGGLGGGDRARIHRRPVGVQRRRILGDLREVPGGVARGPGERQEGQHRHAGEEGDQHHHARRHAERLRVVRELLAERLVGRALHARLRDEDAGRRGDDEGGHLAREAVADGEQGVGLGRRAEGHALLGDADDDAADDVDEGDEKRGDGVPAHEFGCTVHGAEEGGFLLQRRAAGLGHLLVDQARREVGVDGHLLAWHRIEGEAGGDLRDAARTLGDDHEVHDDQDREHDESR